MRASIVRMLLCAAFAAAMLGHAATARAEGAAPSASPQLAPQLA